MELARELPATLPEGITRESNEGDGVEGGDTTGEEAADGADDLSTPRVGDRGLAELVCVFLVNNLLTLAVACEVSATAAVGGLVVAILSKDGRGGGGGGGGFGASSKIFRRDERVRSTVGSDEASDEDGEESSSMDVINRGRCGGSVLLGVSERERVLGG
jgi:hypothetical protein